MSNCQPFRYGHLLFTHNGFIQNFRQTLYRPIRNRLSNEVYQGIDGSTDSEHIFALLINELTVNPDITLEKALHNSLITLAELAQFHEVTVAANIIVTDGRRLVASRFSTRKPAPSLYWLRDDPTFPEAAAVGQLVLGLCAVVFVIGIILVCVKFWQISLCQF